MIIFAIKANISTIDCWHLPKTIDFWVFRKHKMKYFSLWRSNFKSLQCLYFTICVIIKYIVKYIHSDWWFWKFLKMGWKFQGKIYASRILCQQIFAIIHIKRKFFNFVNINHFIYTILLLDIKYFDLDQAWTTSCYQSFNKLLLYIKYTLHLYSFLYILMLTSLQSLSYWHV